MTAKLTFYFLLFLALSSWTFLNAAHLPSGFTEKRIASGLDPTSIVTMPDGRLLITIKSGKILLFKNDTLQSEPLLTIPHVDNWNERGLITTILDPNFVANGYIYTYYTYKNPFTHSSNNRVSRFKVSGNAADTASELVLINFDELSTVGWHNGGGLVYGTDGKIYASTGDNANSSHSQSLNTLLGKVIRIDPDGSIPKDNPFYNMTSGANRAIYALGLRNPWKMRINESGTIYLNEVGADSWEEINELKAGRNYGWPIVEGKNMNWTTLPENYQDPLYVYRHDSACAITGGAFYNPPSPHFPLSYKDTYFFMDYCAGWIHYIEPLNSYAMSSFATGIDRPLDISVDHQGNVYYLSRGGVGNGSDEDNSSTNVGELWKISYTGNGKIDIGLHPMSRSVAVGTQVTFVVSATGDAPLQYQWQRNGKDIIGANSYTFTLPSVSLADSNSSFRAVINNSLSTDTSTAAVLKVFKNTAPVPFITAPVSSDLYQAGGPIYFSGTATDAEEGELPASAFTWTVHFHHDIHSHPGLDPVSGIKSGTYVVPDGGETSDTVWYRILLTVKDSLGTSTTVSHDIYPKKADVTLTTVPLGLPLLLDGEEQSTPLKFRGVAGLKRSIEAKKIVKVGTITYGFQKWSNYGNALQTIATPEQNTTYTATYVKATIDTLLVNADAYVQGGPSDSVTFGVADSTQLHTKNWFPTEALSRVYLRFVLNKAANVIAAKLRLYGGKTHVESSNIRVGVYGVSDLSWNEKSINWNNKPLANEVMIDETSVSTLYPDAQYYEWDVSNYLINAKQNGMDTISFMASNFEYTVSYLHFHSKEAASNKPQLLLVLDAGKPLSSEWEDQKVEVLHLFPNPFHSELALKEEGPFEYFVYDLLGSLLLNGKSQHSVQVGSTLPSGTYVVKTNSQRGTKVGKAVKL